MVIPGPGALRVDAAYAGDDAIDHVNDGLEPVARAGAMGNHLRSTSLSMSGVGCTCGFCPQSPCSLVFV
jgi:hypothetical protein